MKLASCCWIICVAIMVVLILAILFGSGFVIFLYGGYVRENQWDRHTMIAITTDIAITLFLAEEIKRLLPVNLIIIQISFLYFILGFGILYVVLIFRLEVIFV